MSSKKVSDHGFIPRVYSYTRFSRPEQALGRSEERQVERAREFAKKHGFEFMESLAMVDRGRSAYKGDNLKYGALGAFIEQIESGKVRRGDYLVVEGMDRISRMSFFEAFNVVSKIVCAGVKIHTTATSMTFDEDSASNGHIHALVMYMILAHSESSQKADRVGDAWKKKKSRAVTEGIIITSRCPSWLTVTGNVRKESAKIEPIPEAAETIRWLFRLYAVEGIGKARLERKLNAEAPWKPKNGWRNSYIRKILENRAVLGEYQPHCGIASNRTPVGPARTNYFPQIIEHELFYAAQRRIVANRGTGGRRGKVHNLFSNLAKCPYCAPEVHRRSMVFIDKGRPPKGARYLACDNGRRGVLASDGQPVCTRHMMRYDEIEECVLNNCLKLKPEKVLPDATSCLRECDLLRRKIAAAESEININNQEIGRLVSAIADGDSESMLSHLKTGISDRESANAMLSEQLEKARKKLSEKEQSVRSFSEWQHDLSALKAAIAPESAIDARLRLQSHLREFISHIEVFAHGFCYVADPSIKDARRLKSPKNAVERQPEELQSRGVLAPRFDAIAEEVESIFAEYCTPVDWVEVSKFIRWLLQRRMSSEGRFVRIHFRSGSYFDAVPKGSLATGIQLQHSDEGISFRQVTPNIGSLWRLFKAEFGDLPESDASAV